MFGSRLLSIVAVFIACVYCGNDFQSLGRHSWRCKKKLNNTSKPNEPEKTALQLDSEPVSGYTIVKCVCGKECKGMKRLKMHQRRCRVMDNAEVSQPPRFEYLNIDPREADIERQQEEITVESLNIFEINPGIKLPKSNEQWIEANAYFRSIFSHIKLQPGSLDEAINFMNNSIYDFFKFNYGACRSINQTNENFQTYNDFTVKQLKKELAKLKHQGSALPYSTYGSGLLRSKLKTTPSGSNKQTATDKYDYHLGRNFWNFVKNTLEKGSSIMPSFQRDHCTRFFLHLFSATTSHKIFKCPSWIPSLPDPSIPFNQSPPSYEKVTNVIRRLKTSGFPCPLDKISIISFKRCPYLKSFLTNIICILWESGHIPANCKKACTVLVHKKGSTYDTKQRSLVLTLLDLKNAFGEVHHNLIQELLLYHHIPAKAKELISSLYTDFNTSVITDNYLTPAIPVRKGVLQGDCLSPLLFNMRFNTFIQYSHQEKYMQLGFSSHDKLDCLFKPIHWFQFADDAAVFTTNERENQLLLNCFTKWCTWSDMIIRVDKCVTFGIKKFSSRSLQYEPKLCIINEIVPTVKSGDSFKYFGLYFNFEMDNEVHKEKHKSSLLDMLTHIDALPVLPKNKLLLYQRYTLSKLSWHLTVATLLKTWVI